MGSFIIKQLSCVLKDLFIFKIIDLRNEIKILDKWRTTIPHGTAKQGGRGSKVGRGPNCFFIFNFTINVVNINKYLKIYLLLEQ